MGTFVSPGVFTQENDLSFVPQGIASIGAAIIGLTEKGPAFQPTKVNSFNDFRTKFGNLNPKLYAPYAAKNYLQNSDQLTIVRVLSTQTPTSVGQALFLAFGTVANSGGPLTSTTTALAVLRMRNGSAMTSNGLTGTSNNFTLEVNGQSASGLSLSRADQMYIGKVLGTDPFVAAAGDLLTSVYVDAIFDYAYFPSVAVTGSTTAAGYDTGIGGYNNGLTPVIISQNFGGQVYDLFHLESLSDGDASNYDVKVSIGIEPSQVTVSSYPVFTVSVRKYEDSDDRPIVLETFQCTLNPSSNNYIKRVIGDRSRSFNTNVDPPELVYDGEFENKSNYIRVVVYDGYPLNSKPSGFKAIPAMQTLNGAGRGVTFKNPYKFTHLNFAGTRDSKIHMGFDSSQIGAAGRLSFLNTGISAGSTGFTKGFLISTLTAENATTGTLASSYELVDCTTAYSTSTNILNLVRMTVPLYGGWDGIDKRIDKIQLMTDGTVSADYYNAIKVLGNPDELDFNLLTIPGLVAGQPATQGNIPSKAIDMVTTRGDAFYIMDIGDSTATTVTGAIMNSTVNGVVETAKGFDSNYAAVYFPSVRILDTDNNKFLWVPASVPAFGAYAFNDKVGQPWFAPAGLNRGVLNVFEARKRLTLTDRDNLYLGKVNPIATFAGQGIVIWGQKTLQARASALDRVNVRRLLITARKLIASTSKYFVFEPNNGKTRSDLVNAINPILEKIQKNQGIEKFKVVCDESNNTPDTIDRNILIGDIYLQPTRTAEIFIFNFNITRSGVNFAE